MRVEGHAVALATLLLFLASCSQSEKAADGMGTKQAYSLCPKTNDSTQSLYRLVRDFSDQQAARLIDRGDDAQRELSAMDSVALRNTGGKVILLTVEKPGEFRVSTTNLGLKEKVALTVRFWGEAGENSPVDDLMDNLSRFWTIQRVEGGVTNDPPC